MVSRLSIRARITVGSLIVAAVLLSLSLLLVRHQVDEILSSANVKLAQGDLASFVSDITANPDEEVDQPAPGILVFVRAPSGAVQVDTLPHHVHEVAEHSEPSDEQFSMTGDGESFVVVAQTVETSAGTWALWAARSQASSELALEGLDRVLIIGGLVLLMGFGLASWVLASAALRPVRRMRERAATLGAAEDGDLPVGAAHDELAGLATTLNEFLARVRTSASREKQMVSDAAHELRTPLAALRTQLELAHDDFGDAAALALQVRAAEVSVERLSSLATNLLELTRLEQETDSGRSDAAELAEEFTASVDRARLLGLAKGAEVIYEVGGLSGTYGLSTHAFGRLADNLLANAVAAIGRHGSVMAELAQDGRSLTLTVTDDGPGMPESFVAHAFERFTRPDDSRTSATGGSGLGLALVKAIAESAGGAASVTNLQPGFRAQVTIPHV